ncbi:MAG: E3 binding domain-containing protein, partial [Octadecabacter sp.]|nr:E3 binding domain-containing protein [Octadecabacter sp.]
MGIFKMPSLGADMEAGKLVEWLVQPGDTVKRGDVVAVVETQKGAIEIEIFEEGTVGRLEAELGMELPVGAPLAVILREGETAPADVEAVPEPAPAPAPKQPLAPATASAPIAPAPPAPSPVQPPAHPPVGGFAASPAARVRAHELGVDLASLKGSGPGGVIVLSDVEGTGDTAASERKPMVTGSPMQEMRKAIAAAMTRSKQTIPHLYLSHTIDIQRTIDWLALRNEGST